MSVFSGASPLFLRFLNRWDLSCLGLNRKVQKVVYRRRTCGFTNFTSQHTCVICVALRCLFFVVNAVFPRAHLCLPLQPRGFFRSQCGWAQLFWETWQLTTAQRVAVCSFQGLGSHVTCSWILQMDHYYAFYLEQIRLKPFHGVPLTFSRILDLHGSAFFTTVPYSVCLAQLKVIQCRIWVWPSTYRCLQQDSVAKEEIELMRPSSSHRLHVRVFTP